MASWTLQKILRPGPERMGVRQRLLEVKGEERTALGISKMRLEMMNTRKKNYNSSRETQRRKKKKMRMMTQWKILKTSGEPQDPLTPTGSEFRR